MNPLITTALDKFFTAYAPQRGFGIFMLNGGGELTLRGNLMLFVQEELDTHYPNHVVVAEYSNKRIDMAIVKLNGSGGGALIWGIELKLNFTDQGIKQIRDRSQADIAKWAGSKIPVTFVHVIIEIQNSTPNNLNIISKPYVRVPFNVISKRTAIDTYFKGLPLVFQKSYDSSVNYPLGVTDFKTHVYQYIWPVPSFPMPPCEGPPVAHQIDGMPQLFS